MVTALRTPVLGSIGIVSAYILSVDRPTIAHVGEMTVSGVALTSELPKHFAFVVT